MLIELIIILVMVALFIFWVVTGNPAFWGAAILLLTVLLIETILQAVKRARSRG